MKEIELLAPSGNMESLYAAVQKGADAVYLGGSKFSARAYAFNFDETQLVEAVRYCHLYEVKVYVTLNTLVKQEEMQEIMEYVSFLYSIGVDALIVQDVGLIYGIKKCFPNFELHASTQMTIHNAEGALFLKELGVQRIVLSRELSLPEIKYISKELEVETEVFVHGALCICYSGQCLMSSIIGGRSGNRGRCAQPCRLPYTLIDQSTAEHKKAYLLSPKDTCTLRDIKEIINTGTTSLKIEGRMKKPEYVAGVVETYRKAIDFFAQHKEQDFETGEKTLMQLFNRQGFSKAYLYGNTGRDMMSYDFPKNTGIFLGKAKAKSFVQLKEDIQLQDGVRIENGGFTVSKILREGKEVERAFAGETVILKPSKYKEGDLLYKTSNTQLSQRLEEAYKNPYEKKIYLPLEVTFVVGNPIKLTTQYKGQSFIAEGEVVQAAINKPLDKEKIQKNVMKSSETPFQFHEIKFPNYMEGFLPIAAINAVRRELLYKVEKNILEQYKDRETNVPIKELFHKKAGNINTHIERNIEINEKTDKVTLWAGVETKAQLQAAKESLVDYIILNPFIRHSDIILEDLPWEKIYLRIPNIIKEEFEEVCEFVERYLGKIKGIVTANLGVLRRFKGRTTIIGDYKLNLFNPNAIEFYDDYLEEACLSVELNHKEIKEMAKYCNLPLQVMVYGKYELMVSEHCVVGSALGNKSTCQSCKGICKGGKYILKDRMGAEFTVKLDPYCRNHLYNTVPVNLIEYKEEFSKNHILSFRLDFIDESYEETLRVLRYAKGEEKSLQGQYTRGHYKRGVE